MAEISYREKVLLGYSPTNLSNFQTRRNSEVDFSDVFGGPPRRSITHDYYSDGHFKDSFDSLNDDEAQQYHGAWLEKPVFGDEVVGTRRRYQSEDDFYGDIFMGGDQQPQSPTRRDAFSSAPSSRIMSPSLPVSSMVEPFASPAKFSLPAPLASTDFMSSPSVNNQSMNTPSFSTSRLNHTFQNHGVSRAGARSCYRPSPLSHQNSLDGKELASTKHIDGGGLVEPAGFTKDSKDAEMSTNDAQFHFSIYKWAGKGVPSVMPLRKKTSIKERTRFDRYSTTNERVNGGSLNSHQVDMLADRNDDVSTKIEESQSLDDISPAFSNAVSYNSSRRSKDEGPNDVISYDSVVPREVPNLSKRSSHINISNDSLKPHANTTKSYMRSLKFFFQSEENGNEVETPKMKGKESMVSKKGQPSSDDDVPVRKISKSRASQSFREGKVDRHRSEGTNKVKEFVKIFNQESSSKPKKHVLGQSQSSRWDEKSVSREDNKVKSTSTKKHTKMPASKAKESKTLPKASEVEDGNYSMSEKQQFDVKIAGNVFEGPTSPSTEETDAGRDAAPNINVTTESVFINTESPQEIDMILEVEHKQETEDCESKILQWSKGKEGNIRALLSTLQYVLWPDSGWKSVPLVDIIEANAVKKAYQRALLRLHPDKLQQKGAAMHQKFIAEKVFDILQEAWDQFNSTGPL